MKEKLTYNTPNSAEIERHLSEVPFDDTIKFLEAKSKRVEFK